MLAHRRKQVRLVILRDAVPRAVKDARADLALAEHHAGEHHAARSVSAQALNDRAIACLVMRQGAEGMVLAEQHRRLRRGDDIGGVV